MIGLSLRCHTAASHELSNDPPLCRFSVAPLYVQSNPARSLRDRQTSTQLQPDTHILSFLQMKTKSAAVITSIEQKAGVDGPEERRHMEESQSALNHYHMG